MENAEDPKSLTKAVLTERLENHREYVSRQWQYYAAFILMNGLLINAIKDLSSINSLLVTTLALASVSTSGVFFHLINWTSMRIHRNVVRLNKMAGHTIIEIPKALEGIAVWLLFSVSVFTTCWLVWLYQIGVKRALLGTLIFLILIINSLLSTRRWYKRKY